MIYWFEWIGEEGTSIEIYGSKQKAEIEHFFAKSQRNSQVFDIRSTETPKTKADWLNFINREFGAPR